MPKYNNRVCKVCISYNITDPQNRGKYTNKFRMQPNFFAEIFISGYVFAAFSAKLSHFSTLSLCIFLLFLAFL